MPSGRFQSAVFGGLFLGVLSGLPFIGFGNCCCCLWVVGGGMIAAYLLQQGQPSPISAGDGATVGLLAGLMGFAVWQVLSLVMMPVTRSFQTRLMSRMLENAGELPPELRQMFDRASSGEVSIPGLIGTAILLLCVSVIFSTVGGLVGAALFRRKVAAAVPDLPPGFQGPMA